ncbi:MAG: hypothetical protein BYD32DRAFT_462048 [Podila humilis]|nr:MAG: hypothetical protein BYD32DRAFT_462048 [Podila humilis]
MNHPGLERIIDPNDATGSSYINYNDPSRCVGPYESLVEKYTTFGKKWIVVTTINQPTDAMEILCNLPGWNVVVVADTKSPKEWACGSCVYLTVEEQLCLDFDIVPAIPFKAYTRKNIGYLWAIKHGATTIFDTDDDNLPTSKQIIFESPTDSFVVFSPNETESRSINIYSHFGRPDVWPRGFPLSEINITRSVQYLPSYGSLPEPWRSTVAPPTLIQQGLADLDPDVDAIFRLTQGQELKRIKYCKASPTIRLSPGSFCPFNSQNTLFSYDSLWGLVLPISVSFRVCDIWRGYWVQRLLWDVNGSLSFTKPTVEQIRNAHEYLDDFKDEIQLYTDTSRFIDFLANWTSTSMDLETRIVELMKAMAAEKFIGEADVNLAERWVNDLQRVGYVFPKVTPYNKEEVHESIQSCHKPVQRTVDARILSKDALKSCLYEEGVVSKIQLIPEPPLDAFKNILLVVNFNTPYYSVLDSFFEIYRPYFPNIAVYGPEVPDSLTGVVQNISHNSGQVSYKTLLQVMEDYPDYKGYLYTNDDAILNVYQLATFPQDKIWKQIPVHVKDLRDRSKPERFPWRWHMPEVGHMWDDPASFTEEQRARIERFTGIKGPTDIRSYMDAVYIPRRISEELMGLYRHFLKYDVYFELGTGLAMVAVEPTENWVNWNEHYLWYDGERDRWRQHMAPGVSMIHPAKLSEPWAKEDIMRWIETVDPV